MLDQTTLSGPVRSDQWPVLEIASAWDFQQYGMCDQQSLRSACANAQSNPGP